MVRQRCSYCHEEVMMSGAGCCKTVAAATACPFLHAVTCNCSELGEGHKFGQHTTPERNKKLLAQFPNEAGERESA